MDMLMQLQQPGFAVVDSNSSHWLLISLLKMFLCCREKRFMMHV